MRNKSFLRREEYAALAKLTLDGRILDIGGSTKSGYQELIQGEHTFVTANINADYGADLIFDAEQPWPCKDNEFDAVLFINVLEHLYDYRMAFSEAARVTKAGGKVVGVIPFMFNVHGSPNDYFRYTRSALERILAEHGYEEHSIQALGTGPFSVVYHCLLGFVRWHWLADIVIPLMRGLDHLLHTLVPTNKMSPEHLPLGYIFVARKKA